MQSKFVGLFPEQVLAIRTKDTVVTDISSRGRAVSFDWLRQRAGRDRNVYDTLNRGTAVAVTIDQLDQYLYSYALIVARQWRALPTAIAIDEDQVRLIDYGCGQGLAILLMMERYGVGFAAKIINIVLIEQSSVALTRAEAVYRAIAPSAKIVCINKSFDDFVAADLEDGNEQPTVHLFSNVLDISGFDHLRLFGQALSPGMHYVLAISPDRNFDGGTDRFCEIAGVLDDPQYAAFFRNTESQLLTYECSDSRTAVAWIARFEVVDA